MNLSNRLTFSLVFSVLFVAVCAFVATPAMAITTVTAQVTEIVEPATGPPIVVGKKVVTIKYSDDADPAPVITGPDDTNTPADDDTDPDVLAVTKVDNKTWTLTFLGAAEGTSAATIPTITLEGYVSLQGLDGHTIVADDPTTNPALPFVLNGNTLAGKGYAIVATYYQREADGSLGARVTATLSGQTTIDVSGATGGSFPTLPTNLTGDDAIVRRDWNDHYDPAVTTDLMPDLWAHFQQGHRGTLDLTVVQGDPAPIDGTFTTTEEGATTRVGDANARTVVINEVMWGRDESQVGGVGHTREQWIEIYNTKTTPIPFENIRFTISNEHPAPTNASTDRLSTNPNFTTVWDITGKGQDGHPGAADGSGRKEFISMHRTNHANGWTAGHWNKAGPLFLPNFRGTPGVANSFSNLPTARPDPAPFSPDPNQLIINEVYNSTINDDDWLELRAVGGDVNINNWQLTYTKSDFTEHEIIKFPNRTVKGGEVLLIVNKDPVDSNLAAGIDITEGDAANQQYGAGPHKYLNVKRSHNKNLHIPNDIDSGYLMLRTADDGKGHFGARRRLHDVAGPARFGRNTLADAAEVKEPGTGNFWKTQVWPLNGQNHGKPDDVYLQTGDDYKFKAGQVWARNGTTAGWRKNGGKKVGFVGGIGYDRGHPGAGTPGYHNDVVKSKTGDISDGGLIISELMLTTDNGKSPQWIELHNTSRTRGINLAADGSDPKTGWQMIIENHNSGSWQADSRPLNITINLKDLLGSNSFIPPNQTVLIVSRASAKRSRSDSTDYFPDHRVFNVHANSSIRGKFGMKNTKSLILNAEGGFYIKIVDGDGNTSDEVGNLDGQAYDVRKGIGIDDAYSWHWPTDMVVDGRNAYRTSLIRLMDGGTRGVQGVSAGTAGTPRKGVPDRTVEGDLTGAVLPMGETRWRGKGMVKTGVDEAGMDVTQPGKYAKYAWVHAVDTLLDGVQDTYYGDESDIGTPLHTAGTPLPVELSSFRPALENGEVVIRWTTEAELDNAGFNILRSEDRNGEFKQVNAEMIQGHGTTGERHTYKWVDTTAKPGVAYYYQIEDVSFAGERETLRTNKLKGLLSAKNKLTTTWGDLKSQD